LAGFLHKILSPLAGRSESFVKNTGHFIQLLKSVNLRRQDTLDSFEVVSLFTNVPVDEALQAIRNKLTNDNSLAELPNLKVEAIMELLNVCLRTTYFQVDDRFYQGTAMRSSLSPIISNIYMEHFEKLALDSAQHKAPLWLRYVDDTFVIWPHGADGLQDFLRHLNNLRSSFHFTMKIESEGAIPFLDVLVTRKGTALTTKVYKKPTHTGRYLNLNSNHPPHVKRELFAAFMIELPPYAKNDKTCWLRQIT
jgi:hypothetical protein